jgi:anti-sigma factor RsiW
MTCAELMDALVDYLGEELVVERKETFEVHLRGCAKCESYVATYTHTVKITRALPKCGALPPAVEARLRKALEPELGVKEANS